MMKDPNPDHGRLASCTVQRQFGTVIVRVNVVVLGVQPVGELEGKAVDREHHAATVLLVRAVVERDVSSPQRNLIGAVESRPFEVGGEEPHVLEVIAFHHPGRPDAGTGLVKDA